MFVYCADYFVPRWRDGIDGIEGGRESFTRKQIYVNSMNEQFDSEERD